jgi:hypothetical protein
MTKEQQEHKPQTVYQAIAAVTGELAKEGISKDRKNEQQGYKFRGIDDVYNALAPFLAKARLCILPSVLSREVTERTNQKGTLLFYVTVQVRYDFVSADDGSKHEVFVFGEAMDSGDKATSKAMSASYKYACMQAFCIPTEGDNDADESTHEVVAKGEFTSPALRQQFVVNCLEAIAAADAGQKLRDIKDINMAKWNAIGASKDKADEEAWVAISSAFKAKAAILKAAQQKADSKKPATVDSAVRGNDNPPDLLGGDTIPF